MLFTCIFISLKWEKVRAKKLFYVLFFQVVKVQLLNENWFFFLFINYTAKAWYHIDELPKFTKIKWIIIGFKCDMFYNSEWYYNANDQLFFHGHHTFCPNIDVDKY